jgi:exonuclease VII small subunit
MTTEEKPKLKDSLKKLQEIVDWFDTQEEADVETGLGKVKEGAVLIKESRKQLKKVENEFEKVKQELEEDEVIETPDIHGGGEDVDPKEIPF